MKPDTMKPSPGIAWRKVQDQGILIHPRREIMIGLTETGYGWGESLAAGRPLPETAAGQAEFLRFLHAQGLLEPPAAEPPPAAAGPLPAEVAWVEEFRPLAYTASCGRVPGGGGPCEPVPSGG